MESNKMLMSVKDVAEKTGLSESQIRRLIRTGLLQGKKVGNQYVIDSFSISRIKRRRSLNGTRRTYQRRKPK
jgi:excisionase family DNA binding protein